MWGGEASRGEGVGGGLDRRGLFAMTELEGAKRSAIRAAAVKAAACGGGEVWRRDHHAGARFACRGALWNAYGVENVG
jgi:hypothetical protein